MSPREIERRLAAARAVEEVQAGMLVGLGTGRTAALAVRCLSERIKQGLCITAVATSHATADLAHELSIPIVPLQNISSIDLTIDGADEIDGRFQAIKGGGGALLREKVVAAASTRVIAVVDSSKIVRELGGFPLPVEVVPFAAGFVRSRLAELGAHVILRSIDWKPFETDQGNYILDAAFEGISRPDKLAAAIATIPGVVEHGLFLNEIDTIVVANGEMIEVRHRANEET
jgi:ribose 5-phosphate isomerase A